MDGYFEEYLETISGLVKIIFHPEKGVYRISLPALKALKKNVVTNRHLCLPWDRLADDLNNYFRGEDIFFDYPLDLSGYSVFQIKVLRAVQRTPYGKTTSYSDLAVASGYTPHARRAVGRVMAVNRTPLLIPCHRVVRANGETGGYSGGREWKDYLLKLEGLKEFSQE